MKNKLTLRPEDALIKRAKKHARQKSTSVSQIVADYFALIEKVETSSAKNYRQSQPLYPAF